MKKTNDNDRKNELIKKYYDMDEEGKVLYLYYDFNHVSELYDNYSPKEKNNLFSSEVTEKISNSIDNVPLNYKVKIIFEVDDITKEEAKKLVESFNDSIELSLYFARGVKQKRQLSAALLILVGITLIFLLTVLKSTGVLENELQKDVGTEVVDIIAWVFIWEATTLLFLERPKEYKYSFQMKNRVSEIEVIEKRSEEQLIKEESKSIFKDLINETKVKRFAKVSLLGSSIGFIFLIFYTTYTFISELSIYVKGDEVYASHIISLIIAYIIVISINLLAGISGVHKYLDKKTRVAKFSSFYSIFLFIIIVIDIISYSMGNNHIGVFGFICSFIIQLLYVTGCMIDYFVKE